MGGEGRQINEDKWSWEWDGPGAKNINKASRHRLQHSLLLTWCFTVGAAVGGGQYSGKISEIPRSEIFSGLGRPPVLHARMWPRFSSERTIRINR